MERSRVLIVTALLLLPLAGLEARLFYLQVVRPGGGSGDLLSRSIDLAPASRGRLLDRRGRVLAEDVLSFDLHVVIEEFERRPEARRDLAALLGRPVSEIDETLEEIYRRIEKLMHKRPERERPKVYARERRTPYPLTKAISRESAYAIETQGDKYPGLVVREGLRRSYPLGEAAGHVVGYLARASSMGRARQEGEDPKEDSAFQKLLQQGYFTEGFDEMIDDEEVQFLARRGIFDGIMIPRDGVERTYDDALRGHPGLLVLERDPATGKKNWVQLLPPRAGEDVRLSIDVELQKEIATILADARGEDGLPKVAVAMVADPATGEILAMATNASYDPNAFIPPTRTAELLRYQKDEATIPLRNRFVQGSRHGVLGSIFKIVTSVAALQENHIRPDDVLPCRGQFRPDLPKTNCWVWNKYQSMHGDVSLAAALEQSCNCYFYGLGDRMPLGHLVPWAAKLGFGVKTGIDLPYEDDGNLPVPATHPKWRAGDSYSLYIGQHELLVTPVQVLKMICAVANGGFSVTPRVGPAGPKPAPMGIRPSTLSAIREGLKAVVHGEHGTARQTELHLVDAAGKTGSATFNVRDKRSHAWFAGYAPSDRPQYAIVVLVEDGGGGGHTAAPLGARIATRLLARPEEK